MGRPLPHRMQRMMERTQDMAGMMTIFRERFVKLRGYETLAETVERTGLSKQTVCDILSGKKKDIGMATVMCIALAYGTTLDYLFGLKAENVARQYLRGMCYDLIQELEVTHG